VKEIFNHTFLIIEKGIKQTKSGSKRLDRSEIKSCVRPNTQSSIPVPRAIHQSEKSDDIHFFSLHPHPPLHLTEQPRARKRST
jgi:hypothetical protein